MTSEPSVPGCRPRRGTVVIVDDHKIIRETLRLLLAETDTPVVGEAESGSAALECVKRHCPDVVILDVRLPDESGFVTASRILEQSPSIKVLMLSGFATAQVIKDALLARVYGFVTKQEPAIECVRAVRNVMNGTIHLSPEAMRVLARNPDLRRH